jgi:peptidyl-prolyl cis-trans isomerase C
MLKSSILAALLATSAVLPGVALAADETADTVVATVNGQDITLGQMIVMKQSLEDPQLANMPDQAVFDMMLDQLVRQAAVAQQGTETAGTRAELELQRRNTLAATTVAKIAQSQPSDDEVQAAYDKMFADAEPTKEFNAAHILVETEEKAKELKKQLDNGAEFGALAEANSTGPSGPNKGDLGWFAADQMVPPFAEAVKAMEKGQISDPVKTDFGWHVIQLNDTRMAEVPTLEELRPQLVQSVLREKVQTEVERLATEAEVEKTEGIDPALLSKIDLLEAE